MHIYIHMRVCVCVCVDNSSISMSHWTGFSESPRFFYGNQSMVSG